MREGGGSITGLSVPARDSPSHTSTAIRPKFR
jgi:hypothetical protein